MNIKTQRKQVSIGLGIGLEASRRKPLKRSNDGFDNEERHVYEGVLKVKPKKEDEDGKKDEKMEDCESVGTSEDHEKSKKGMNSKDMVDCGGISVNDMNKIMMHEVVTLGEMSSSNVNNIYPAEPNYLFGNRKKAGFFLSISRKD